MVFNDTTYVNSDLKKKKIKHGVREVERSHFVDEDGEFHEDEMIFREERRHFQSDWAQKIADVLVWMRCLAPDPEDMFRLKNWIYWVQWMALICDLTAAIVALVTFSDVTYCCGKPILDFAGSTIPWKRVIRILTFTYVGAVFLEIYPVVRKGFPFNLVNPLIGFIITFAMFFDDSKAEALAMWGIETAAILCEYVLYRLKIRHRNNLQKQLRVIGLSTKNLRDLKDGEDPDAPQQELTDVRRRYFQLKQESASESAIMWYLAVGCYINIALSLFVFILIIVIAQGGGLCVDDFQVPNPFDLDQFGRCSLCANTTGVCEICNDDAKQCYYPYS